MTKVIKGFGIRNQQRRRIRGELFGSYEGLDYLIRSETKGLFYWSIGKLSGYGGPTLCDVLRKMKRAAGSQKKLIDIYGDIDPKRLQSLDRLTKWEYRALQGRLEITGPHGKAGNKYYKVKVLQQ